MLLCLRGCAQCSATVDNVNLSLKSSIADGAKVNRFPESCMCRCRDGEYRSSREVRFCSERLNKLRALHESCVCCIGAREPEQVLKKYKAVGRDTVIGNSTNRDATNLERVGFSCFNNEVSGAAGKA